MLFLVLTLLELRMAPFGKYPGNRRYIRTRNIVLESALATQNESSVGNRLDDRVLGPQADDAAACETPTCGVRRCFI